MRFPTVAVSVAALAVAACTADEPGSPGGEVIASFGSARLTTEDFRREMERLPPRSREQLAQPERKRQFVDNFVLTELLVAEGRARGYDEDPDIVRQVEDLRRRLVVQRVMQDLHEPPEISDEELRAYHDENPQLFAGGQIRASHILVKDEALARSLRDQILADPARFDELARAHSTDTATAARGGDLGSFGQGRMVAEFERAAFGLAEVGDVSEVVKTPFGYHVIKLTERKEGAVRPFEEIKDRIRIALLNQRRQQRVTEKLEDLKREANLTVHEDVLARTEIPGVEARPPQPRAPAAAAPGGPAPGLASPTPAPSAALPPAH